MRAQDLAHVGDVFAIPGFALLVYYFSLIESPAPLEIFLFFFSVIGLVADCFFTTVEIVIWWRTACLHA
jgi:hypothetical protein